MNVDPAAYDLPYSQLNALANRFSLLGMGIPFYLSPQDLRDGRIFASLMSQLQAWFDVHGLQIWTTSTATCNSDRPRVKMLTIGKRDGRAYFKEMARDTSDLRFKDLSKKSFTKLLEEGMDVKLWLCPDGHELFVVSSLKRLPKSTSDPTQQLAHYLHPCSALRFYDGLDQLDAAVPPTVAGRCKSICSRLYPRPLSDASNTLWKPVPAWKGLAH
ncbi:hypothetical protein AURDEDRAFT_174762 [Auricularia subglabra TFB-10046 SS5]|uniref:Uncharacterized protein n=1 Tax=Auricularia subglabra (strain TFB-10046 / SS5) TaxID=717982 RepID=J0WTZ7_AURST|nr:hypothetical protein AURDEDRAFT_174762 [Auricularia subglabra TFB-10046 SS5]